MTTQTDNPTITAAILDAFEKWINQRPELEPGNYFSSYGSPREQYQGRRAYRQEQQTISAQRRRALTALSEARAYPFDAEQMREALRSGFSGRLSWNTYREHACTCGNNWEAAVKFGDDTQNLSGEASQYCPKCHKKAATSSPWRGRFDYCTGQYYPTEYRIAAAVVLERYNDAVRPKQKPEGRIPRTMAELREMDHAAGGHFFSREAMRFFRSRVLPNLYLGRGGVFFVTSEEPPHGQRAYTVRRFNPQDGDIGTVGEHCEMGRADALALARKMAETFPRICHVCAGSKEKHGRECWHCKATGLEPEPAAA